MNDTRWRQLMNDDNSSLTEDDISEGWHWCTEFDGLLVGPGMTELCCCKCLPEDHRVYQTKPKQVSEDENIQPF